MKRFRLLKQMLLYAALPSFNHFSCSLHGSFRQAASVLKHSHSRNGHLSLYETTGPCSASQNMVFPFISVAAQYSLCERRYSSLNEVNLDFERFEGEQIINPDTVEKDVKAQVLAICTVLSDYETAKEREDALKRLGFAISSNLIMQVLLHLKHDWKSALFIFDWATDQPGYSHTSETYNLMVDILGKMRIFEKMWQLIDEMHNRGSSSSLVTEETFTLVIRRYAGAHLVEKAVDSFYRRKEFGLEINTPSFQVLLMALCRYKHVEEAESLLNEKQNEFPPDMKSRNIILHGWCTKANVWEAKRYWNSLIEENCAPDLFTYSSFISALTNKGKIHHALTLYESMWNKGPIPDVKICNTIIDALCFKKRIPQALVIFEEMKHRGCHPDTATYNSLIKHLCNIGRVDKAFEIFRELEVSGHAPSVVTYHYFLKVAKTPEEIQSILERMSDSGCMPSSDTYNLLLKAFTAWGEWEKVQELWHEMQKKGMGPDDRSYTVMIHGLYEAGKLQEAYSYYNEMTEKGFSIQPRTKILVKSIEIQLDRSGNNIPDGEEEPEQVKTTQFDSSRQGCIDELDESSWRQDDQNYMEQFKNGSNVDENKRKYKNIRRCNRRRQIVEMKVERENRRKFKNRKRDNRTGLEHEERPKSKRKLQDSNKGSVQNKRTGLSPGMAKLLEAMQRR